jgi:murein DD-endopeptidase MepM/ murein hydrolase activator NlpD
MPAPPPGARGLSVIVARSGGKPPWRLDLSPAWIWIAGILLTGILVAGAVAVVTYIQAMGRINELSSLTVEVETLRRQNEAVQELEAELRELRELQQQMLHLAGIESALGVDEKLSRDLPGSEDGADQPLLLWPIDGETLREFGPDHPGVDLSSAWKGTVAAAGDGVVIEEGRTDSWGHRLVIEHSDSLRTVYANNEMNLVTVGDRVEAGQVVALVGRGPEGKEPHLHFEVWMGGKPVPPRDRIPDLFPQH